MSQAGFCPKTAEEERQEVAWCAVTSRRLPAAGQLRPAAQAGATGRGGGAGRGAAAAEGASQPPRIGTRYNVLVPTKEHKLCKCAPLTPLAYCRCMSQSYPDIAAIVVTVTVEFYSEVDIAFGISRMTIGDSSNSY